MTVKDITGHMGIIEREDFALVEKAFEYSKEAHKNQKRYSGEPYFIHLFETAKNLAELGADAKTVSAGLLHDVIEDGHRDREEVRKEFGDEILFLIEGVTKLGKLKYHGVERHVGSLRKLFVAMSKDIRVLIIKLTDRLHNMETLQYVPEEKRQRIALETLEIYAPLAYRLGMNRLNRRLEDLSFEYTHPKEFLEIKKILKERSKETQERLEKILRSIKKNLAKEGFRNFSTDFRLKGVHSFYQKLERKKIVENIYDISAIRIVVPTESDCYRVLGIIHSSWRPLPGRIKDYIAFPKPNGYQSIHTTVFTGDGGFVEIQIRTEEMHRHAEYGIASHLSYKDDSKKSKFKKNIPFSWIERLLPKSEKTQKTTVPTAEKPKKEPLSNSLPAWVKHLADDELTSEESEEFLENLRGDFLRHRMFVFTPKGDPIDLPLYSTSVDFAYAIHSEIGDHMFGAKVNGKLVSLDTPLINGDTIEIITKSSSKPSPKWLDYTHTAVARHHIRSSLSKSKR